MSATWRRRLLLTLAFCVLMAIAVYAGELKNREATVDSGRVSVSLLPAEEGDPLPRPLQGAIELELAGGGDLVRLSMDLPPRKDGAPRPPVELIMSGSDDVYLRATERDGLPPGKSWLLMGSDEATRIMRGFGGGLASFAKARQFLSTASPSEEDERGSETIDGTETTRYEISADFEDLDHDGISPDVLSEFGSATGGTLEMTAWIDEEGFTRRLQVPVDGSLFGVATDVVIQYDVDDLGEDVEVEVPSPGEVVEY